MSNPLVSGLINEDGSINWNCPCLGGMATGPCGPEFREAFSCFHYSTEEPKGSDCFEAFKAMQDCMGQYPSLYPRRDEDEDDEGTEDILELDTEKDSGKNSESKNIEKSGSERGEADESHDKSSSKSSDQGKS